MQIDQEAHIQAAIKEHVIVDPLSDQGKLAAEIKRGQVGKWIVFLVRGAGACYPKAFWNRLRCPQHGGDHPNEQEKKHIDREPDAGRSCLEIERHDHNDHGYEDLRGE